MTGQPDFCNRCGDRLDPNGLSCYQKHCNYKKYSDEEDDDDDYDEYDYSLEINNQETGSTDNSYWREKIFNRDKKEKENEESEKSDDSSDGNDSDAGSSSSSDGSDNGGCLDFDGLGDGCIGGFLKLIWKIITFPIRVIMWIAEIFD